MLQKVICSIQSYNQNVLHYLKLSYQLSNTDSHRMYITSLVIILILELTFNDLRQSSLTKLSRDQNTVPYIYP